MSFHQYRLNELYSNADGSIQFIELLVGNVNGESFWQGQTLTATQGSSSTTLSYSFPSNLPNTATANKPVLVATQGFANLGLVVPDFIVPAQFLFTSGGTVNFAGVSSITYASLPSDGIHSIDASGTTGINSPTNFAGASASIALDTQPPTVTITDNVPGTANAATGSVSYALAFSEPVTGLDATDFVVTNATLGAVSGSGSAWSVNVVPAPGIASGSISLTLKAGAVVDAAGNGNASAANTSQALDTVAPVAPKLVTSAAFNFLVDPQVSLQTSLGTVVLELDPVHAPVTTANLLAYVNGGFYDGTLFHRVIPGFMVQGGGLTAGLVGKTPTYGAIVLESNNGLSNLRGTIAMARTGVPDSATSQFFINQVDNSFLNYSDPASPGYAVFGRVLSGLSVIDSIANVPTTTIGPFQNVPVSDVTITSFLQTLAGSSITNAATLSVSGLESGALWSYSLNGGSTWAAGTGTSFAVPVGNYAANAIQVRQTDAAGNLSASNGKLTSALVVETTAPTVNSFSPADEAGGVPLASNIVLTFSENIVRGSGLLLLKNGAGSVVESYDAATSPRLTVSGATLSIDPSAELALGTDYRLELAAGNLKDLAGNIYAGTSSYNFTTSPNTAPTGTVGVGGTPTQGEILTASNSLADSDGLGAINYQWKANGISIGGATGATLLLTQAQVGKTIAVTASYTDGHGTFESVTSAATGTVANINDAPTVSNFGNRTAGLNEPLSLNLGMLFIDPDGDALSFAASGLPAGLSIDSATGILSGTTPNALGVHHLTVTGTDPANTSASLNFDLDIIAGHTVSASVVTRGGLALPGVTAHEVIGTGSNDIALGRLAEYAKALPDTSVTLSLVRGTSDYLVNGTTKPITAADALDALKLSVGLASSKGSSWKELIAADMNHDGRVTAADALEILKTSVGINTIQPSWIFVPNDAAGLATMTRTTVSHTDSWNLASITAPTANTFTGILVGDVNNSWLIPA